MLIYLWIPPGDRFSLERVDEFTRRTKATYDRDFKLLPGEVVEYSPPEDSAPPVGLRHRNDLPTAIDFAQWIVDGIVGPNHEGKAIVVVWNDGEIPEMKNVRGTNLSVRPLKGAALLRAVSIAHGRLGCDRPRDLRAWIPARAARRA